VKQKIKQANSTEIAERYLKKKNNPKSLNGEQIWALFKGDGTGDEIAIDFIKNFDFDEEDPKISKVLGQIHQNLNLRKIRVSVIVPKDYFLGSQLEGVPEETSLILEGLSKIMDLVGQRGRSIIVRIGSAYGNRKSTMSCFVERYLSLSDSCRKKICLVNDEKPSLFSVKDLLPGVFYKINIPIVFRSTSYPTNQGNLTLNESLLLAASTWKRTVNPLFIYLPGKIKLENENSRPFGLDLDVVFDNVLPDP
jgi:UV DNA damage repair endonuclease